MREREREREREKDGGGRKGRREGGREAGHFDLSVTKILGNSTLPTPLCALGTNTRHS